MKKYPGYPNCLFEYSRKFSELLCPTCQLPIPTEGRTLKRKESQKMGDKKRFKTGKTHHEVMKIDNFIYSVYHHKSLRVFVHLAEVAGEVHMCDHPTCIEERGLAIKNRSDFKCRHIISVLKAIFDKSEGVNKEWRPEFISKQQITSELENLQYDCRVQVLSFLNTVDNFAMIKLANDLFTLSTPMSNKANLGFVHLYGKTGHEQALCSTLFNWDSM